MRVEERETAPSKYKVYLCDFCDEESPLKSLIEEHEAIHKLSKKPVFINGVEFYYFRTPEEMSSLSNNKIGIFSGPNWYRRYEDYPDDWYTIQTAIANNVDKILDIEREQDELFDLLDKTNESSS